MGRRAAAASSIRGRLHLFVAGRALLYVHGQHEQKRRAAVAGDGRSGQSIDVCLPEHELSRDGTFSYLGVVGPTKRKEKKWQLADPRSLTDGARNWAGGLPVSRSDGRSSNGMGGCRACCCWPDARRAPAVDAGRFPFLPIETNNTNMW